MSLKLARDIRREITSNRLVESIDEVQKPHAVVC
jgi:hypothetical protein